MHHKARPLSFFAPVPNPPTCPSHPWMAVLSFPKYLIFLPTLGGQNRCYVKNFTYDVSFFTYDVTFFT